MSAALDRFNQMQEHCGLCSGQRAVIADQARYEVRAECDCGVRWVWKLFSELKKRQPEGFVEKFFQDDIARTRLAAFLNGVLFV